jgi:hypothetical protein
MDILSHIIGNRVIVATVLGWFFAQTLKVILGVIRERRFDFNWFIGTGGMPSAHSSSVMALATSVGLYAGFDSINFAICFAFAVVAMSDAQGVRRATGKQAQKLNQIVDDLYHGQLQEKKLIELIGHTPFEVIIGAILGVLIALYCYSF